MSHRLLRTAWQRAREAVAVWMLMAAGSTVACGSRVAADAPSNRQPRTLVASVRTEPRSFNRYVSRNATTDVITALTQASLVKIDRSSGELRPELAVSWRLLPDGATYELVLRDHLRFSDGEPFTSADVTFSFEALYDPHGGTALGDTVRVRNQPLRVQAIDPRTVRVTFPGPFGPGLRLLDGVPMLPRHKLEAALREGRFAEAWGAGAPASDVVGLGPFVLEQVQSGQAVSFRRNPHYVGASDDGPDRIVLRVITDPETELLLLQAGEIDLTPAELRPSDYGALVHDAGRRGVSLRDLGLALDGDLFWLNLSPRRARQPSSRWLQQPAFRSAIALSVDRAAFVDSVYFGAALPACGLVSPGNREWVVNQASCRFDVDAARQALTSLGLSDSDGDGVLDQPGAGPVRFTLVTQRGNVSLERGAAFLRDSLARIGVAVDVVSMDPPALVARISSGDYDAAYFKLLTSDTDPALNADFWRSSGAAHVWNPEQSSPATTWERRIDALMGDVEGSTDPARRHEAFSAVQAIVEQERPAEVFAYPRLWIATSQRIAAVRSSPLRPFVLWNPLAIEVRDAAR